MAGSPATATADGGEKNLNAHRGRLKQIKEARATSTRNEQEVDRPPSVHLEREGIASGQSLELSISGQRPR